MLLLKCPKCNGPIVVPDEIDKTVMCECPSCHTETSLFELLSPAACNKQAVEAIVYYGHQLKKKLQENSSADINDGEIIRVLSEKYDLPDSFVEFVFNGILGTADRTAYPDGADYFVTVKEESISADELVKRIENALSTAGKTPHAIDIRPTGPDPEKKYLENRISEFQKIIKDLKEDLSACKETIQKKQEINSKLEDKVIFLENKK